MTIRPLVAEWLRAQARDADETASRLGALNRHTRDATAGKIVTYWRNQASALKSMASIMEQTGEIPDRAPGGEKDVRRD